jgi:enoyl-CoA hydratase
MTPDLRNLRYELREGAAWITIHRPEKLNALDRATVHEIPLAIERATADPQAAAIVLTGAGDRAFVAGADIGEMAGLDAKAGQDFSLELLASFERVERAAKPVIAAVNGFALGGGCELAMACHVRIASEAAKFGQPEVLLGLIPGAGGTQRLTRLVGRGKALDLILSGDTIDAAEAHRIGLVDRLVPAGELVATVDAYVARLRQKSPVALARALQAVISGSETPQAEALRLEAALFGLCFATEDFREGTRAFLEKRKPAFPGR